MLITKPFYATLTGKLMDTDQFLNLNPNSMMQLMSQMEEGDYTYLTISDRLNTEIVKATKTCFEGGVMIERGQGDTEPRHFPFGSCVTFEVTTPVVKDLICNYECCDGPCVCEGVAGAGITMPTGIVGVPYTGTAIFTGDTPMTLTAKGFPAWAEIFIGANYIRVSGVPNAVGTYEVGVAATNCHGTAIAIQSDTLNVIQS